MLIFSTKLCVNEHLIDEKFIDMAIQWVSNSKNYSFPTIEWDNTKKEITTQNLDATQKFTILKYENIIAVHLVNKHDKVIGTSDFELCKNENKNILATQLYRDVEDISVKLHEKFSQPLYFKRFIAA